MNYAKAVEGEYARLFHAAPRPEPKGPKYHGMKKLVIDIMADGRERTAGDVAKVIGCSKRSASFWLGRLRGGGDMQSELFYDVCIYWLTGSQPNRSDNGPKEKRRRANSIGQAITVQGSDRPPSV